MDDSNAFGNWLTGAVHSWKGHHMHEYGREPSDADFARKAGIPTTSLSVWKTGTRRPTGENIDRLANELGMEVYDRLGLNRKMLKKFNPLANLFDRLSPNGQKRLLEIARNMADEETSKGGGSGSQQAA
jgi:hypothetical protein